MLTKVIPWFKHFFTYSFNIPTLNMLILKIKVSYITNKTGHSGISENCNSGQASYRRSHMLVQQTKQKNVALWRRNRKLGGVVLKEISLEKNKSSG